jgi:hypothetical protein
MRLIQGKHLVMDKEIVDHRIVEMLKQDRENGTFVERLISVELQDKQVDCPIPYPN